MCELLTVVDSQIIQVALNGLENILKAGDLNNSKPNPYAMMIEECYGKFQSHFLLNANVELDLLFFFFFSFLLWFVPDSTGLDKIEFLQSHNIREIYQKAFYIIESYFNSEEEEDGRVAPSANNNQYQFNADQSVPMGGFQF